MLVPKALDGQILDPGLLATRDLVGGAIHQPVANLFTFFKQVLTKIKT